MGHSSIRATLVIAVLLATALPGRAGADRPAWVFHFDPDTAPTDPGRFKAVVGAFLVKVDERLKFQPFRRRVDFERELTQREPSYLIVGLDYFRQNRNRLRLRPLLLPARRGKHSFQKVIITRLPSLEPAALAGRSLAATALRSNEAFDSLLGPIGVARDRLRIVHVTKDVDAILALAFGQVDAAMVRPESIDRIRLVNPNAVAGLRTIYTTRPVFYPPLCQVGTQTPELTGKLVAAFRSAAATPLGQRALRVMGFDAWTELPPEVIP